MKFSNNSKKKDKRIKYSLFSILRFLFAFLTIGFVVSVSFFVFFSGSIPIEIPEGTLNSRAFKAFLNILFLCFSFSIIDSIRKRITFGIPINRLLDATHEISQGNLDIKVKPVNQLMFRNEFDIIIEDFNKMIEELQSNAIFTNDFIANVSHEFKTPLSVIQNYALMLQDPDLPDEKRIEYAKILSSTTKNLSDLISNILKLNKLENQQIFSQTKEFNLGDQICECMILFESEWEKKELNIDVDLEDEVIIKSDYELLYHVWNNIFSNAIKFNKQFGELKVSLKKVNETAVVKISDSGCGMNEETKEKIFEKFYQGDTSHSTKGNGLGMSLVKRVLDITKGKIEIESELGIGTTFTVILPIKPED